MNLFKEIFARVWALWGLLTFIITFFFIFIPSMFCHLYKDEKKGQDYFITISKIWMTCWLFLIACRLKVKGKEHFKKGENYVVTFNHNALLDVPLSAPFVPGGNKTIAKDSFAKVPIFGWFYKRGGILVNRKIERSRIKGYEEMRRVLALGIHMSIYPEGTRNRTDEPLKPFYDGAFKLAVDAKKDIIPTVIKGTKKAMPIHKTFYLLPTKLTMEFLPPISSANLDAKTLKNKVFEAMKNCYVSKF
jgi:1-acyl-sn-glycerol-3-phosphate acyltransferase